MNGIRVLVSPPSPMGALKSRYDGQSGILSAESCVTRAWPFGINIDSALVFDIDAQGILANLDLLIPKRLWVPGDVCVSKDIERRGDALIAKKSLDVKSFNSPVKVKFNSSLVFIEIGFNKHDTVLRLSDTCSLLLYEDYLAGIIIQTEL